MTDWRPLYVFALIFGVLAATCAACERALTPPQGPGTEYPCGYHGQVCDPVAKTCCDEEDQCGAAGTSCPEGQCCFVGPWTLDAMRDGGARTRPQWVSQ